MFNKNEVMDKPRSKVRQNKEEILALWSRKDRNGDTYYTGKLGDGTHVLAFYNKDKGEGVPALRLFKTERKDIVGT